MTYVYKGHRGMGLADLGGRCSQVTGGSRVCASTEEAAQMRRRGCRSIGPSECDPQVGGEGMAWGEEWCCPPAATERPGEESVLDEILIAVGVKQPTTPAGPTATGVPPRQTAPGEPSAGKFAQYTGEVARTEAAAAEMATLPIEEGEAPSGLQQYMPHIMIASTAVGLLTFVGWVVLRKKD
jgi:hypothetical protein